MKKALRYLIGALLAVFVSSVSPLSSQLKADYTFTDDREPPGEPEAHTYHVHAEHYYETWGPYLYDEYSWSEDYDETIYTSPGDSVERLDHLEETSGNDGPQYYYSWNYFSYS